MQYDSIMIQIKLKTKPHIRIQKQHFQQHIRLQNNTFKKSKENTEQKKLLIRFEEENELKIDLNRQNKMKKMERKELIRKKRTNKNK